MDFSPDKLRKRFKDLTAEYDALDKKLQPLRDELDKVVAGEGNVTVKEARKREEQLRPKIKELQEKQYPIEMERAAISRALGGKTGEPE